MIYFKHQRWAGIVRELCAIMLFMPFWILPVTAQKSLPTNIEFEGGDNDIRKKIRDILSVQRAGPFDSKEAVSRREALLHLMVREGYWGAEIRGPWTENDQVNWRVAPGPVWSLTAVHIVTIKPDSLPIDWFPRKDRIRHDLEQVYRIKSEAFLKSADDLLSFWDDHGHPFASVSFVQPVMKDGQLSVTLEVDPGPLVFVKEVDFRGSHHTRPEFLKRVIRASADLDEPYDERHWKRGTGRLQSLGLFAGIYGPRLELIPAEAAAGSLSSRVVYQIEAAAYNQFEAVAGYSGQNRTLSGIIHINLGNLFGTGRSFGLMWERREKDHTGFNLRYDEPSLWKLPLRWYAEVAHFLEDTLYTRTDFKSAVSWEMDDNLWLDVGYRHEKNVAAESLGGKNSRSSSLFGLRWEGLGGDPDREKGLSAGLSYSTGKSQSSRDGLGEETVHEIMMKGEGRHPLPFLGVGRLLIQSSSRILKNPIPMYETYLIGGSRTLRGYREEAFRVIRYGVFQMEVGPRLGPGGARWLVFLDTAIISPWAREDGILGSKGPLETHGSYGIGIRSLSRRGLVCIDYGVPWGEDPTAGRLHLSFNAPF